MSGKKKAAEGGLVNEKKGPEKAAEKKTAPPSEIDAGTLHRMKSTKIPKLAKKNKPRLPRRQKKALKKAKAAQLIQSGDQA